jgi:hypothetical protein
MDCVTPKLVHPTMHTPFLLPCTNYYLHVVVRNILLYRLNKMYIINTFVEEMQNYYIKCNKTLCKLKLHYLPSFSNRINLHKMH